MNVKIVMREWSVDVILCLWIFRAMKCDYTVRHLILRLFYMSVVPNLFLVTVPIAENFQAQETASQNLNIRTTVYCDIKPNCAEQWWAKLSHRTIDFTIGTITLLNRTRWQLVN